MRWASAGDSSHRTPVAFVVNSLRTETPAHFYAISEIITAVRPGDINGDGFVRFDDFLVLAEHFGERGPLANGDITGDGFVAFDDFLVLATNFESDGVEVAAVPEPRGFGLVVAGGWFLAMIRRKRNSSD